MANTNRNEEAPRDAGREPEASVLGSLPRERPGRRSPRRAAGGASSPGTVGTAAGPGDSGSGSRPRRGVEDLAWAGVAVAAEAATLGVRLANRMLQMGTGLQERSAGSDAHDPERP